MCQQLRRLTSLCATTIVGAKTVPGIIGQNALQCGGTWLQGLERLQLHFLSDYAFSVSDLNALAALPALSSLGIGASEEYSKILLSDWISTKSFCFTQPPQ
jgi:hypothetical protein